MALSYEEGKRIFLKTILILAAITICEVLFALLGKGYLIDGVEFPGMLIGLVMIVMSVVKAYLIIYEFMHMKYEAPGMVRSVLFPTLLLVWGIIAFIWDGDYWMDRRNIDSTQIELTVPVDDHADGAQDGDHDTHHKKEEKHSHDEHEEDHGHDHHHHDH